MNIKNAQILIFTFIILTEAFCQVESDTTKSSNSFGVIGAPFLSYSPETRWSFGAAGLFYFNLENEMKDSNRISNIYTNIQYTTRKQFTIKTEYDFYFYKNNYRIYGDAAYSKFPYKFFGAGNNSPEENEVNYTPKFTRLEINVIRKILKIKNGNLNAGIRYDFRDDKIIQIENNGLPSANSVAGWNGGTTSGAGISINFDSRDNSFSATSGEYLDFKSTLYDEFLGSDFTFNRIIIDIRKFFEFQIFDDTHVLAFQTFEDFTNGTAPFYLLPTFGGEMNLRGIFNGRFKDKNSFFLQTEYRFPVFWRFGLALYVGTGETFREIHFFSTSGLKFSGGIGIRFLVIEDEKITVRLDSGFSKYSSEFYLSFNEAF